MGNDDENLFDITFDLAFLSNAVTAQMQVEGVIGDSDRMVVEYIELDEDAINVIARKIEGTVN